ncbi:MAG: DJ-1/PfpI family protein [Spirulina sp. SIO3F2]|nr:DJ-1/PfpI family protein [Spirulina sp. SIO3F2]
MVANSTAPIHIGFLLYPGVIQLDVLGAYQVLAFPPQTQLYLISETLAPIVSNEGLMLTPTTTFANCPRLDVVCVPGGGMGQVDAMQSPVLLDFLRWQAQTAQYITSVCTGSLVLAAAGLLQGYQATCHWAFCDQLEGLGVEVVQQRVVCDRNRITGAGVTSGIDFGLLLLAQLCGEEMAKMTQLMLEYDPKPPFRAGTPEGAGNMLTRSLLQVGAPLIEALRKQSEVRMEH